MSAIEDKVCIKILKRAEFGAKKYGVTMQDEVLSTLEWLNHLQQELMDGAVYVEKLIQALSEKDTQNQEFYEKQVYILEHDWVFDNKGNEK